MINVVGVRFQQDGKMLYYDAGSLVPHVGDYVVAETGHGHDLGEVILGVNEIEEDQTQGLPRVIRLATPQDIQQATDNRAKERDAFYICQRKIAEHKLEMKLVSVESTFDNSKMMFYFTANGRVDFRALVKDLASTFRTRIELRQIGVRDEARMLGGLGPCGRPICCGAFLNDFQPVSIRMAKDQNLSLNPTKISGVCGRLMCCLKYEQDQYEQTRKRMPRQGRDVITPDGRGTVTDLNIVKETVSVRIPNGDSSEIREYPLDKITRPGQENAAPAPTAEADAELETTEEILRTEELTEVSEAEILALEDGEESTPEPQRKPRSENRAEGRKDSRGENRNNRNRRPKQEKPQNNRFGPRNAEAMEEDEEDELPRGGRQPITRTSRPKSRSSKPQQFGRPVRRENPDRNRDNSAKGKKQSPERENAQAPVTPAAEKQAAPAPEAKKSAPRANGWADALEKAMQAAEQ